MGVPITFLDKYNPDQFEILGITLGNTVDYQMTAIYENGQGKIKLRGKVEVEELKGGKKQLVISEIPYTMIGSGMNGIRNHCGRISQYPCC